MLLEIIIKKKTSRKGAKLNEKLILIVFLSHYDSSRLYFKEKTEKKRTIRFFFIAKYDRIRLGKSFFFLILLQKFLV